MNQLMFWIGNVLLLMSVFYPMYLLFLGKYDDNIGGYGLDLILNYIGVFSYFVLHELGHAIGGYFTGYDIKGFGIGKFGFIKENNRYKFRRLSIPNAGAYYIAVKKDKSDKRFGLMMMGGILMHLVIIACLSIGYLLTSKIDYVFHVMINIGFILTNLSNVISMADGSRYFEMKRNPKLIDYTYEQMDISYRMLLQEKIEHVAIEELPLAHSFIVQSHNLLKGYQYLYTNQLLEAKRVFEALKDFSRDKAIIGNVNVQLLEIAILEGDKVTASTLFKDKFSKLYLSRKTKSIALIRAMYFMYIEEDAQKAQKQLALYYKYKEIDAMCYEESQVMENYLRLLEKAIRYSQQYEVHNE